MRLRITEVHGRILFSGMLEGVLSRVEHRSLQDTVAHRPPYPNRALRTEFCLTLGCEHKRVLPFFRVDKLRKFLFSIIQFDQISEVSLKHV